MIAESFADVGIDTHDLVGNKGICPKCGPTRRNRRDRSLSVDVERGLWNCHNDGCDFAGRLHARSLPRMIGGPKPRVYERPKQHTDARLGPRARAYLQQRGIDTAMAEAVGVTSTWQDDELCFAYLRDGHLVGYKYRTFPEKHWRSSVNSEPIFYGLDRIGNASELVIVEGEFDALSFWSAGVNHVISVPNGAMGEHDKADGKLKCMETAVDLLERVSRVIVATDNDPSGKTLGRELVRRIGPEKCWQIEWPAGIKDANDMLVAYGEQGLHTMLAHARPIPIEGLIYFDDVRDEIWETRDQQLRDGVEVAWPNFRDLYRIGRPHMTIVTGEPSSGKSIFLSDLLVSVVQADPSWSIAVFSPETVTTKFFGDLVRQFTGKSLGRMSRVQYDQAGDWVNDHFFRSSPNPPELDTILELARLCVLRHGIKGVVIDPWTEVQTARNAGMNESEHIKTCLARIRHFGTVHRCHMWVVAHPTKIDESRADKPVTPYQISGSANWYNQGDSILSVYREERSAAASPVQVHVMKQRDEKYGAVGVQRFGFDLATKKYYEIGGPT